MVGGVVTYSINGVVAYSVKGFEWFKGDTCMEERAVIVALKGANITEGGCSFIGALSSGHLTLLSYSPPVRFLRQMLDPVGFILLLFYFEKNYIYIYKCKEGIETLRGFEVRCFS